MPRLAALHGTHVNLTVSDLDRSVEWYCPVFGLVVIASEREVEPATDSPLRYRSLASPQTMSYVVGLIEHPDGRGERFDERRPAGRPLERRCSFQFGFVDMARPARSWSRIQASTRFTGP